MGTYQFKGKTKYYKDGSNLCNAWHNSLIHMVEIVRHEKTQTWIHCGHAFEYKGKMYAVMSVFPKNLVSFRFLPKWKWLFKILNRRAWSGVYLRELKEV